MREERRGGKIRKFIYILFKLFSFYFASRVWWELLKMTCVYVGVGEGCVGRRMSVCWWVSVCGKVFSLSSLSVCQSAHKNTTGNLVSYNNNNNSSKKKKKKKTEVHSRRAPPD